MSGCIPCLPHTKTPPVVPFGWNSHFPANFFAFFKTGVPTSCHSGCDNRLIPSCTILRSACFMISEVRIHPDHEVSRDTFMPQGRRALPLMCPHCQQPIQLTVGLCGSRLVDAILLQAERIGTELECRHCGLRFVFHRTRQGGQLPVHDAGHSPSSPVPLSGPTRENRAAKSASQSTS